MINRNSAAAALVVAIAIGDAALFVVTHNFVLRSAGMAALVFAVYFLRKNVVTTTATLILTARCRVRWTAIVKSVP